MKYILTIIILSTMMFVSCASMSNQMNASKNMTKVELNMTKQEVTKIMGKTYEVVGSRNTQEGSEETIGYHDAYNDIYLLTFLNGKLVEFHKEWLPKGTPIN
ncbi:MAG: hypothetical protein LBU84_15230 [Prevotella sp.]|nr:hypothetical protein [Prevotella sp.]